MKLSGLRSLDKSATVCFLFVVSGEREPQCKKLLVGFEPTKAFLGFVHGRSGPAQSHRRRTPALHIAGDATHGPHHIFDDVGAGQRAPQFRRKTEPAHCEDFIQSLEDAFETPGASRSRRWARLRISFSAFAASPSSQAWRNARRTEACRAGDRRSMMFRALWIWQRWIGVWRPKLRRIALASAFEPPMMNRRGTAGSRRPPIT